MREGFLAPFVLGADFNIAAVSVVLAAPPPCCHLGLWWADGRARGYFALSPPAAIGHPPTYVIIEGAITYTQSYWDCVGIPRVFNTVRTEHLIRQTRTLNPVGDVIFGGDDTLPPADPNEPTEYEVPPIAIGSPGFEDRLQHMVNCQIIRGEAMAGFAPASVARAKLEYQVSNPGYLRASCSVCLMIASFP